MTNGDLEPAAAVAEAPPRVSPAAPNGAETAGDTAAAACYDSDDLLTARRGGRPAPPPPAAPPPVESSNGFPHSFSGAELATTAMEDTPPAMEPVADSPGAAPQTDGAAIPESVAERPEAVRHAGATAGPVSPVEVEPDRPADGVVPDGERPGDPVPLAAPTAGRTADVAPAGAPAGQHDQPTEVARPDSDPAGALATGGLLAAEAGMPTPADASAARSSDDATLETVSSSGDEIMATILAAEAELRGAAPNGTVAVSAEPAATVAPPLDAVAPPPGETVGVPLGEVIEVPVATVETAVAVAEPPAPPAEPPAPPAAEPPPPAPPPPEEEEEGATMTIIEHLEELRQRLTRSAIAVVVGAVLGWFGAPHIVHYLQQSAEKSGLHFVSLSILGPFALELKLAFMVGIILSSPVTFYQVWAFVAPGLTRRERHYALPFSLIGSALFALGAAVGVLVVPLAIRFLATFFPALNLEGLLDITQYIMFITVIAVIFGITFELPIFMVGFSLLGVVNSRFFIQKFRIAIFIIFGVSMVITPGADFVSPIILGVFLVILYWFGVLLIRFIGR